MPHFALEDRKKEKREREREREHKHEIRKLYLNM